jgi:DNA-binding transcriptional ArsR family regulator
MTPERQPTTEDSVAAAELIALLSDGSTREILHALTGTAKSARTLVEETDASRSTVYRRLDRLQRAGLVEATMAYDADGHHRETFRATVERATLELGEDGVEVLGVEA